MDITINEEKTVLDTEKNNNKKKKDQNRITINFVDEYIEEYEMLSKEKVKSKSEVVCKALREYYAKKSMEKSDTKEILERLDIMEHLLLDIKKQK